MLLVLRTTSEGLLTLSANLCERGWICVCSQEAFNKSDHIPEYLNLDPTPHPR